GEQFALASDQLGGSCGERRGLHRPDRPGGLLARGLAGLVWAAGIGVDTGSAFYPLNLALYTPLCLAGAAAAWTVARAGRPDPGSVAG
ncbi:hypothetical protein ABZ885_40580, partial [Kitasatospora sp. NPDC047058]